MFFFCSDLFVFFPRQNPNLSDQPVNPLDDDVDVVLVHKKLLFLLSRGGPGLIFLGSGQAWVRIGLRIL
jgi:hypothetical protein